MVSYLGSAVATCWKNRQGSQTEFPTVASPNSSNIKVRIKDIFSNFLVQRERKPVEALDMEREERLQHYGRVSGKPVELSQEIFISKTDSNKKFEKFVSNRSNLDKFWKQIAKVNLRYWLNCALNGQWRMKYQTGRAKRLTRYLLNGKLIVKL